MKNVAFLHRPVILQLYYSVGIRADVPHHKKKLKRLNTSARPFMSRHAANFSLITCYILWFLMMYCGKKSREYGTEEIAWGKETD